MGQRAEQIEKEIEQERGNLDRNLHELEHRVRDATNWRVQFQKHPGPMLGTAFAIGVGLAAVTSRNGKKTPYPPSRDGSGEAWQILKTAIVGALAKRLSMFVDELISVRPQPS